MMPSQTDKPLWKVTRVTDVTLFLPSQGPTPGKKVEFQLANGTLSALDVPLVEFTPERVTQLVEDAAAAMYGVLALQSQDTLGSMGMLGPQYPPPGT